MRSLYLSQQAAHLGVRGEQLVISIQGAEAQRTEVQRVAIPLVESVLAFGTVQLSTQAIRACLARDVPIAYLSRLGFCHGRTIAIARGYRHLARYQMDMAHGERILTAQHIIAAKLHNSRLLLMRQRRRRSLPLDEPINQLAALGDRIPSTFAIDQLMGLEGAAAATYFQALRLCIADPSLGFEGRNRRPPRDPVNALLSFGYQVLWNHLLVLLELQGLDPYLACLHSGSPRHAGLVSDLLEEFRAPVVDALVLTLITRRQFSADRDVEWRDGGCFLNASGRRLYLENFVARMEETIDEDGIGTVPRWEWLGRQVRAYRQFVYSPIGGYQPFRLRS